MLNAFKKQSDALISKLGVPVAPVALVPVKWCEPVVQPPSLAATSLPVRGDVPWGGDVPSWDEHPADLQASSWERSARQPGRRRGGRR